jgi:hypothetical protein
MAVLLSGRFDNATGRDLISSAPARSTGRAVEAMDNSYWLLTLPTGSPHKMVAF